MIHSDIGVGFRVWGQHAGRGWLVLQALGASSPSPPLQKACPVTSTQCSPTHEAGTSLFLTDIKICSDKLSATAEI